jgi:hypothetical protein
MDFYLVHIANSRKIQAYFSSFPSTFILAYYMLNERNAEGEYIFGFFACATNSIIALSLKHFHSMKFVN